MCVCCFFTLLNRLDLSPPLCATSALLDQTLITLRSAPPIQRVLSFPQLSLKPKGGGCQGEEMSQKEEQRESQCKKPEIGVQWVHHRSTVA